jgi:hypothetical protein
MVFNVRSRSQRSTIDGHVAESSQPFVVVERRCPGLKIREIINLAKALIVKHWLQLADTPDSDQGSCAHSAPVAINVTEDSSTPKPLSPPENTATFRHRNQPHSVTANPRHRHYANVAYGRAGEPIDIENFFARVEAIVVELLFGIEATFVFDWFVAVDKTFDVGSHLLRRQLRHRSSPCADENCNFADVNGFPYTL